MGSFPKPHWFLVRPDNTITPLIAVDELPANLHIVGVPATMSVVDTKSMESVGVRERSVGTYDVHDVPAAIPAISRGDSEEYARTSSEYGSDPPLQKSVGGSEPSTEGRSLNGLEEAPLEIVSSKSAEPQAVKAADKEAQEASETNLSHLQDEEATNVEKWRRDVETPDETQARIDAVIAASGLTPEDPKPASKDENPRADLAKAGLIPGKKVYCSHWIRSGDCDFVQQGCLYKHEMPDDDTLRAIGIRALPSWYIAAHPEKARKRGWGSGNKANAPSSRSSTWKPPTAPLPTPSGSFRMPLQAQHASFQPPGRSGHSAGTGPSFLRPHASHPHTFTQAPINYRVDHRFGPSRVQELSDHQYQQWQDGVLDHPNGLQLMQKPSRSPGYKTFPFPVPGPMPATVLSTPNAEPKPLWPPRQSKFTKVSGEENLDAFQKQDGGTIPGPDPAIKVDDEAAKHSFSSLSTPDDQSQLSKVHATTGSAAALPRDVHHEVIPKASKSHLSPKDNGFTPLKPSTIPELVLPKLSTRDRQSNGHSNPFERPSTDYQKAPRRMFTGTAREGQASGSNTLERSTPTRPVIKNEPKKLLRNEPVTFKEHCQIRADEMFGRKNVTEDSKKKLSCSPEGKPKAKRAVKKHAPAIEPLLDFEN